MLSFSFVILDILEESFSYKQIKEIVPSIWYNSCNVKDKCNLNGTSMEPTDLYISFFYPSIKFTFSFPDIIPGGSYYTLFVELKKNIPCQLLLEDKERFTRRPVIWKKEINDYDPAKFDFLGNNETTGYQFALSIR